MTNNEDSTKVPKSISTGNFKIIRHTELKYCSRDTLLNSILLNVKCGDVIIAELDYFSSSFNVKYDNGKLKCFSYDAISTMAKTYTGNNEPIINDGKYIVVDGELFKSRALKGVLY